MEYMRLEGFLGGAVSKLINKGIQSKFGYKPAIEVRNLMLTTDDEQNEEIRLNATITMKRSDFDKLLEEVTK